MVGGPGHSKAASGQSGIRHPRPIDGWTDGFDGCLQRSSPRDRRLPRGSTSRLPLHSLVQHERGQQAGRRGRCDRVVLGRPGLTTRPDAPHPRRARRREPTNSRARMSRQDAGWRVRPKSVHGRGVESSIPPANRLDRTPGNDRQHPCPPLGGATRRTPAIPRGSLASFCSFWPASTMVRPVPGPSCVVIPHGLRESSRFDRSTAGGIRMVRSVSLESAS